MVNWHVPILTNMVKFYSSCWWC